MNDCKLTECRGRPRCERCLAFDGSDAEALLPAAYLLEKLAMVIPLFEEARDALTAITEQQRVRHGISASLADRMDVAGTYSLDDWRKTPNGAISGGP